MEDVKKKWRNIFSDIKKKLLIVCKEVRKIGGGVLVGEEFNFIEYKIVEIIG